MKIVNLFLVDVRNLKVTNLDSFNFTKEEKQIIDNLKTETAKIEKAVSFLLKRKFIGEYSLNEFGKPISKDKEFNVSHSKGYVAIAISDEPVGLDIEYLRLHKEALKKMIASEKEERAIESIEDFFKVWTSKESLVKCVGTGFKEDLKSIPALPFNGIKKYKDKIYYSKSCKEDDLIVSITLQDNAEFEIVKKKLDIKDL